MIADGRKPRRVGLAWNGGRNGWHSFLVGVAYSPAPPLRAPYVLAAWRVTLYLGLWVARVDGRQKLPGGRR